MPVIHRRLAFFILLGLAAGSAAAQTPEPVSPGSKPLWTLTGDFGALGEVYRISGRENRRPSETGRMFLRPTFEVAGRYTIRSEFLLSTEGSSALARHNLNQYMVNPSWTWGATRYSARIGDFSDAFTPTTFSGVQIRGGSMAVQRAQWQAEILGGRTKPSSAGGPDGGSYRQTLFAGRLAYGDEARAVSALVLYASDDSGSLPALPDTAGAVDSTEVGTVVNPYAVTPQENLVVAVRGNASLLDRRLLVEAEVGRSDYTRDRRAAEAASGRVDYAVDTKARYRRKQFEILGGYKRIGPGFVSLGVSSMHADQQEILAGGTVRIGSRTSMRAHVSRQNDNLAGQKEATTIRYRYVTTLGVRPSRLWAVSFSGNYVTMANDALDDSMRVDFRAWILGMNHTVSLGHRSRIQSVSVAYTLQASNDDNPLRQNSDAQSHTANLVATVRAHRSLTALPSIGYTNTHTGAQGWRRTMTYGLALQHRALANRLTNTLSNTVSAAEGDRNIASALGSRYTLTRSDALELRLSMNHFRGTAGAAADQGDYEEYTSRFGWTHRF